jgi:hypothetical protein
MSLYKNIALAAFVVITSAVPSYARGNDLTVTDGMGEGMQVKNGFFGRKDVLVKDRLGDGYRKKKGFFGSKEEDANILGNQFQAKKGWFGSSTVKGHDILGDSITTRKGFFGRRTTSVDVSGAASAIQGLLGGKKGGINPSQMPPAERGGHIADPLTPLGDPNAPMSAGAPVEPIR